jgi:hypothetical protein
MQLLGTLAKNTNCTVTGIGSCPIDVTVHNVAQFWENPSPGTTTNWRIWYSKVKIPSVKTQCSAKLQYRINPQPISINLVKSQRSIIALLLGREESVQIT